MAFNSLGKFDNTIQWKADEIKATNIFTTCANTNCGSGVSETVCKSRYDALDVKRKEELQNALDIIAWMPVAGNAMSMADSFKVLLTGTGIAGLEQNRLLAAANIVSAGFGNRVTRVQGVNTTIKNVSKTTTAMARGRAFEKSLIEALGAHKNNQLATVKLPDGTAVRTIPDLWGKSSGGIVEVKDVMSLSLSK
ncbi:putative toxin [Acinetobacter sp. NIPH 2699]|uniref:putative toxin n=1 Tax=Acinetobacter sp. NIPH 2699 TaxID=2923433 RepID=UPI001F4A223E|nr:putative toxin [Acinetobacter sp. NIPH 2699]MCH7336949.1 putative toxin [Acinetobacter sp. NIPH 2699]